MAKIEALASVGVFTKDLKRSREFYTRKIGLKVRESIPEFGYLALGATKGGDDAALTLWQPDPSWGADYGASMTQIGTVSGIGFLTSSLDKTVEMFRRRKVKVDVTTEEEGDRLARFHDADDNVLFAFEPARPKVRKAGLSALGFVTIVTRDDARIGEFYMRALGMKKRKAAGEEFVQYRLALGGSSLMPFMPRREMYDDPADFDADMAHIGEATAISFTTRDLVTLQDVLMARGVRFSEKAERAPWGGMEAKFLDPDDNVYQITQPRSATR